MKKLFIILSIALLVFLPLSGCQGMVKGSGELKTRDFTRSDFSEVSAGDGFEVKIIYATSYNVTITADDNLTAGDVHLKADAGSTVQLGGSANDLSCEAGGSSLVKLEAFSVRNANIKMSGESTARLQCCQ